MAFITQVQEWVWPDRHETKMLCALGGVKGSPPLTLCIPPAGLFGGVVGSPFDVINVRYMMFSE